MSVRVFLSLKSNQSYSYLAICETKKKSEIVITEIQLEALMKKWKKKERKNNRKEKSWSNTEKLVAVFKPRVKLFIAMASKLEHDVAFQYTPFEDSHPIQNVLRVWMNLIEEMRKGAIMMKNEKYKWHSFCGFIMVMIEC